ncbi:MAG: putative peptidoglycan glycosyltransferase FtsW [Patescibacteria group bacterium]
MKKKKQYDKVFLGIVIALLIFGVLAFSSASLGLAMRKGLDFYNSILKQFFLGMGLGIFALILASKIDYHFWRKISLLIFAAGVVLTLLVFVPGLGIGHGGAIRWLDLKIITFQPSEFLKFGFILYLASWMASRKNEIGSLKFGFLPFLIMVGLVSFLLIIQPDIGTLGVISLSAAFLFFVGGGRFLQIGVFLLAAFGLLVVLVFFQPHLLPRIQVFLNPDIDPQGIGYQLRQSLIALGSGGIFGRGFGMSVQKFSYLPEPMGDSIFAVIGEEFGFLGTVFVVVIFLFFLLRGMAVAKNAPDFFGRLLGFGLVILIVVQSFVNISAMSGLIPLTGLPLLFISQGGTALAMTLAEVGILLNISKKS